MNMTINQLSTNGVNTLVKEQTIEQPIIVQISQIYVKKEKVFFYISDGNFQIKATTKQQGLINPKTDLNKIILIKKHVVHNNIIGIVQFENLFDYEQKIGNPQAFTQDNMNPENNQTYQLDKALIKVHFKESQMMSANEKTPAISKKVEKNQQKQIPQILAGELKDYETINTLYIGMPRWTIVCRIVKLQFKQFISKNTGKQTKTLNLELMDRAGMKIAGVFFGDSADSFNGFLIQNRIYKISKGQIREQSYNNSKNDKMSPYKLVFTNLSTFEQVSDTNSIAKNEDSAITLGECIQRKILNQQFDVIGILIKVQDTIEVKKEQSISKKTNLMIADPIKNATLIASVWSESLIPRSELVGKSIILTRFKLHQYRNALTLTSNYRSSIIPVTDHAFQKYENQAMEEFQNYDKVSEIVKTASDGSNRDDVCKTLKQLEYKIDLLDYDQWTKADVTVFINKFNHKKWHYEGCPHCNKSAQKLNSCNHCTKYVQKTINHFILGIQISDSTGSIWTTAYDQFAKKIFDVEDQSTFIDKFLQYNSDELKEQTQKYLYQEFRLRISTKKDKEGKIKHNVSKLYQRDYADQTQKTIELINKLLIS